MCLPYNKKGFVRIGEIGTFYMFQVTVLIATIHAQHALLLRKSLNTVSGSIFPSDTKRWSNAEFHLQCLANKTSFKASLIRDSKTYIQ
jgi:hypothetical protein